MELLFVISSTILADASPRIMQALSRAGDGFPPVSCMLSSTGECIGKANASSSSIEEKTKTFKAVSEVLQNNL